MILEKGGTQLLLIETDAKMTSHGAFTNVPLVGGRKKTNPLKLPNNFQPSKKLQLRVWKFRFFPSCKSKWRLCLSPGPALWVRALTQGLGGWGKMTSSAS